MAHKPHPLSCPHCAQIPRIPFRFRIRGRFLHDTQIKELGSATTLDKAKDFLESFKRWPAIDPQSLSIIDSNDHPSP